jgi:hypothetical protein
MSLTLRELNETKTLLVSFFRLASEHKKFTAFTIIIFMLLELLLQNTVRNDELKLSLRQSDHYVQLVLPGYMIILTLIAWW